LGCVGRGICAPEDAGCGCMGMCLYMYCMLRRRHSWKQDKRHTRRHGLLVPALSADMSLPACAPLGSFAKRLRARVGDEAFDSPVVCRVHGQPGRERL